MNEFIFTPHCIRFNTVLGPFLGGGGGGGGGGVREYPQSETFWDDGVTVTTAGPMGTLLTLATVKALAMLVTRAKSKYVGLRV